MYLVVIFGLLTLASVADSSFCPNPKLIDHYEKVTASSWYSALKPPDGPGKISELKWKPRDWSSYLWDSTRLWIDFGSVMTVSSITLKGVLTGNKQYETFKYKLFYKISKWDYEAYKSNGEEKIFIGKTNKYPPVENILAPPVRTQILLIVPLSVGRFDSFNDAHYLEFKIKGCSGLASAQCPDPKDLGVRRDYKNFVLGNQISASSYSPNVLQHIPSNARLNLRSTWIRYGAWKPNYNNAYSWLQIDFKRDVILVGMSTQGRDDTTRVLSDEIAEYVMSYTLSYSKDGIIFQQYTSSGSNTPITYNGNTDRSTVVSHSIVPNINARVVRIHPKSWKRAIALRVEFQGCYTGAMPTSPPPSPFSTEEQRCIKKFASGTVQFDVLMEAFFALSKNARQWWTYEPWLTGENHDARELFPKLWSYYTKTVAGSMSTIYYDYYDYYISQSYSTKISSERFDAYLLGNILFGKACNQDITVKNDWPFTCIDHEFFCGLYYAATNISSYLKFDKNRRSIKYPTTYGISATKGSIISPLFSERVLGNVPEKMQADIYYSTPQLRLALNSFLCSLKADEAVQKFSNEESYAKAQCSSNPNSPLSKFYYCKVMALIKVFEDCGRLADPAPCAFHPLIQEYFSEHPNPDSSLVSCMAQITKTHMTKIYNAVYVDNIATNAANIRTLLRTYDPFVTVNNDFCRPNWKSTICDGLPRQPESCKVETIFRFDCTMKFILTRVNKMLTNRDYSAQMRTNLLTWLAYPPFASLHNKAYVVNEVNRIIVAVQKDASKHVKSYDQSAVRRFASELPPGGFVPSYVYKQLCAKDTIETRFKIYCYLSQILGDVHLYLNVLDTKRSLVRTLNPSVDYVTLIGQMQSDRIQTLLTYELENYIDDLTSNLHQNFGRLSNYFSSISGYDKKKYEADIGYIRGKLDDFEKKINETNSIVQKQFGGILTLAITANALELASRAMELGVAMAQASNPLAQALGGFDFTNLLDRINTLAQTGVVTTILVNIGESQLPELIKMATDLGKKFAENDRNITIAKKLVDGFKDKTKNMEDLSVEFLDHYSAYTPQVDLSEITLYGSKWEVVAEQLCEAAFAGGAAATAVAEIGLASTGDCVHVKNNIAALTTVYEEMYQYQFDLMDSLSDATRAYLADQKATEMKEIYTSQKTVDNEYLSRVAIRSYIISIVHVWKVVFEYCDVLTYINAGVEPMECQTALKAPSHRAVANVMSLSLPKMCNINNEHEGYRHIPIRPSSQDDTGFIDLEKLYKGEKVKFTIPDLNWLKTHGWISRSSSPSALFINRFELFLPPMSGSAQHTVTIHVQPSQANYLGSRQGTKFLIPLSYFTTSYTENSANCYKQYKDNPYAICNPNHLTKVCIESNGYFERELQPSIFNEWEIWVSSMPLNQVTPKPATNFKLQAGISYCTKEHSGRGKKRDTLNLAVSYGGQTRREKRSTSHCCASTQYWNGGSCSTCPRGTVQQLMGYYCE